MPIYYGENLISSIKRGVQDISKVYYGENLVLSGAVTPPPAEFSPIPSGATFNEAFEHLISLAEVNHVHQFISGSATSNVYRQRDNIAGTYVNDYADSSWPDINFNWLRFQDSSSSSLHVLINKNGPDGGAGSINNDFVTNAVYANSSIYIINYSNMQQYGITTAEITGAGGGWMRKNDQLFGDPILFPTTTAFSIFYQNTVPTKNCFFVVANTGLVFLQ